MADDKIVPGWGAVLRGEDRDLDVWKRTMLPPFEPWVQHRGNEYILRSAAFDGLTDHDEVRLVALPLIERLNGATALNHGSDNLHFGGVARIDEKGLVHRVMFAEGGAFRINGGYTFAVGVAIGPDGKPLPPPASTVQNWSELAENDGLIEDALVYFGKSDSWYDTYKCLECLMIKFGEGEAGFLKLSWEPRAQVELLKRTANWERHARRRFERPDPPMPLRDARSLLAKLMQRAMKEAAPK